MKRLYILLFSAAIFLACKKDGTSKRLDMNGKRYESQTRDDYNRLISRVVLSFGPDSVFIGKYVQANNYEDYYPFGKSSYSIDETNRKYRIIIAHPNQESSYLNYVPARDGNPSELIEGSFVYKEMTLKAH